ncbi:MAG: 4Fe-4S binding protein [Verrucomicrobia bacterium]|nr:4Fe-4S binding protein [Verrucomicrobiota bacterium]
MAVVVLMLVFAIASFAEQRFPPPEFESGYALPETKTPPPRTLPFQYVDVAVLLGALVLASYLVLKKRSRNGVLALSIFSVVYFGFYRKGCVCAIGSIQNIALGLFDSSYAVPWVVTAFFIAPLAFALFAGRSFCAAVCPHGALQDLMLWKPVKVPAWLEQGLGVLPFAYLGAAVLLAATGSAFIICEYDPFVPLFRMNGSHAMLLAGVAFLLAAMFVGRPYCRFLCPYGALLRLASCVSKWRVTVTPDSCNRCRLCEEACPFGAIEEPTTAPTHWLALIGDRKRLAWLLALVPALMLAGGWFGSQLSIAASQLNPTVALAERFSLQAKTPVELGVQTAESLALMRAAQDPKALISQALEIRRNFRLGGWLFGGWLGLAVGAKLISLAVRRSRHDYEPNRASCFACARCFSSCPNERVRLGLMRRELPGSPAPQPAPAAAHTPN